ncbi:MAG: YihY/virulence factor BrkB family protein [Prevotella sp.]|jgi:membrane protein|nr:YihY/virulence factor BrkB family protein [Prevotella sp.]MCI1281712.1 YihY/virulence factor BrkB family protein [Prevotella sp.]
MIIRQIVQFFAKDIWQVSLEELSPTRRFFYVMMKKLYLAIRFFIDKGVVSAASALTYSTMLAIVPIFAVVFAIARGFGFSKYIEVWFRDILSSQPQAAETIIKFVNSYLVHTHSGIFLGIGLLFMLWTVLMLIRNIEVTFNNIWQVKSERSLIHTITDYMAMFFLLPIIIVVTSGLSIFLATIADQAKEIVLLGPLMRCGLDLMPYILMSAAFIALYVFMPNTKVRILAALFPGILAGVAMQLLQFFYIHCQIFLSSYNAIYGSLAALPLFMLWVQISWTICLFGAELCYTNQNLEDFAFLARTEDISHRYKMLLSAMLLSKICKRFAEGKKPFSALELKLETGIPIRITNDLLDDLRRVNLVAISGMADAAADTPRYQPAEALQNITLGTMVDRLESIGSWSLNIDLHALISSPEWASVYSKRKEYFDNLRQTYLKDL